MEQKEKDKVSIKKLNSISLHFTIDGKEYGKEFVVEKEAKKEDAYPIGVVMQKWVTELLEEVL